MDLSGVIFVVLAVSWAVYLIPKALQHHDEVARTRSIDRFSNAMRVLARREPVNRRESRLVVTPVRSADNPRMLVPQAREAVVAASATIAVPQARVPSAGERAAARAAVRRRRLILCFLLLCTAVVTALAAFSVVPWWSVAVPGGLTLAFLVLSRTQVRRARRTTWNADLETMAAVAEEVAASATSEGRRGAARVQAPYGTPMVPVATVRNEQGFEELDPNEATMAILVEPMEPVAVQDEPAVATLDGGTLWDPLPVTLPTYVTKPKAKRTVRTIDLGAPGTWTSGRTAEDAELAARATADATGTTTAETPRAVGS